MAKQHDDNEVLSTSAQPDETPPRRPWQRPQIRAVMVVDATENGGANLPIDGGALFSS